MPFLQLIRFPNLLIVILTQYLLQYLVLVPSLNKVGLVTTLDHFHFSLLVFTTVLIAAGGYIINDIIDYEIDLINNPEKVIINKKISASNAQKIYIGIIIFGFFIALYLAYYVNNIPLVSIYPIAVLLLYLYSKSLKKSVLWGNIIVSIFCAFVAGVVLFAEREAVNSITSNYESIKNDLINIFSFYLLFAFFSTLFREIIKDIEDVEGDQKRGCKTLPIVAGIYVAKVIALAVGLILLVLLIGWGIQEFSSWHDWSIIFFIIGILIPLIISIILLMKATSKKAFHQLSNIAKMIILSGLIYLILWSN